MNDQKMTDTNEGYTHEQRLKYMEMTDNISDAWLKVFGRPREDKTFWDTGYWDLFTKLWRADREVKKNEAIGYMTGKTTLIASKLLDIAKEAEFIKLRDPKEEPLEEDEDKRSLFVSLTPEMKQRIDDFYNQALVELEATVDSIRQQSQ